MYTLVKRNNKLSNRDNLPYTITINVVKNVADHRARSDSIVPELYRMMEFCEKTWGRTTEYDMCVMMEYYQQPIASNPHWTYDFGLKERRFQILLASGAELKVIQSKFNIGVES